MDWPNDADGDVFRSLERSGLDFSKDCLVEFNVDFAMWPPSQIAIDLLSKEYPSVKVYAPDDEGPGYIQFQVYAKLTYELVTSVQAHITELMEAFGGKCESWGVLHTRGGG
jgi:hypothetical protein